MWRYNQLCGNIWHWYNHRLSNNISTQCLYIKFCFISKYIHQIYVYFNWLVIHLLINWLLQSFSSNWYSFVNWSTIIFQKDTFECETHPFLCQVNNAGIIELGTIENTSMEQYDRLMNTNVRWEDTIYFFIIKT